MELNNETLIARNKGILANRVGDEVVMMDMEKGKYFGVNKTGSYIWQLLEQPATLGELCERLVTDFGISTEQCTTEVMAFVEQMQKENIIAIQ